MAEFEQNSNLEQNQPNNEKLGVFATIVAFVIPLVGLVLYFTNKHKAPQKSKTACYAALAGGVLATLFNIILEFI